MTPSRYPLAQLYEEVAFVAYHFNWSHREVLALPHWERHQWCAEISRINDRMNDDADRSPGVDARTLVANGSTGDPGAGGSEVGSTVRVAPGWPGSGRPFGGGP